MKITKSLTDLDASHNKIKKISNLSALFPSIEILNVSNNDIDSLSEAETLKECLHLKEIDIQNNLVTNDTNIQDFKLILTKLNLELVNGKYTKKREQKRPSSALMRPMSANQLVSERLISDQLQYDSLRLADFEEKLKLQFTGIKGMLEELPKEKPKSKCKVCRGELPLIIEFGALGAFGHDFTTVYNT